MQILLFGGNSSGKSSYAEELVLALADREPRYYVATMESDGVEAAQRIKRHQAMRKGKGFTTIEQPRNLDELTLQPQSTVLLECLGTLVANEMFASKTPLDPTEPLSKSFAQLRNTMKHVVIVSNDIGADGTTYTQETTCYQRAVATLNQRLAAHSHIVIEMVCGIPLYVKGEDLCPLYARL